MTQKRQGFDDMLADLGLDELGRGAKEHAHYLYQQKLLDDSNARALIESYEKASLMDHDAALDEAVARAGPAPAPKRVERIVMPEKAPERALLFSRHVAELLGELESVRAYRESIWGNPSATLSSDAAHRLLASPALTFLSREELRARGVPLDGSHTSSMKPPSTGGVRITVRWPGHKLDESFPARPGGLRVHLPGQDGWVFAVQGSFLHGLAMSAKFVQQVCGWSEQETMVFLITGAAPAIDSLRVETAFTFDDKQQVTQAWVTVRAMPYVTPEECANAVRAAQKRLGLGVRRPIEPRNLTLLKFVADNPQMGWPERLAKWNKTERRKWRYRFPSRMQRDYDETARRVHMLDFRPAPDSPTRVKRAPAMSPTRR
jgi:hypothetical protein